MVPALVTLSDATGFSRHALSRWLNGRAEPTLGQALAFIEAATHRGLDFVACFVDPEESLPVECVAVLNVQIFRLS
ncbi:MAG: helix-turn-helix domain-containing protein [Myxococcota bacterium]